MIEVAEIIAIIVFLLVIIAIMTEKVHRTAAALVGAVCLHQSSENRSWGSVEDHGSLHADYGDSVCFPG